MEEKQLMELCFAPEQLRAAKSGDIVLLQGKRCVVEFAPMDDGPEIYLTTEETNKPVGAGPYTCVHARRMTDHHAAMPVEEFIRMVRDGQFEFS